MGKNGNFDDAHICRSRSIASCNVHFCCYVGIVLRHANHMQNDVKDSRIEIMISNGQMKCTHTMTQPSVCASHSLLCIGSLAFYADNQLSKHTHRHRNRTVSVLTLKFVGVCLCYIHTIYKIVELFYTQTCTHTAIHGANRRNKNLIIFM